MLARSLHSFCVVGMRHTICFWRVRTYTSSLNGTGTSIVKYSVLYVRRIGRPLIEDMPYCFFCSLPALWSRVGRTRVLVRVCCLCSGSRELV